MKYAPSFTRVDGSVPVGELVVGIVGIIVSVALYWLGLKNGRQQESERQRHELALENSRQQHARALEADRRRHELNSKVADEYVSQAMRHIDAGPHLLGRLGLEQLGSDAAIRDSIEQMRVRSGADPWSGESEHLQGVDLLEFFRFVREQNVDFFRQSVADAVAAFHAQNNAVRKGSKKAAGKVTSGFGQKQR